MWLTWNKQSCLTHRRGPLSPSRSWPVVRNTTKDTKCKKKEGNKMGSLSPPSRKSWVPPIKLMVPPYPNFFGMLHGIFNPYIYFFSQIGNNTDFAFILPNKRQNSYFYPLYTHFLLIWDTYRFCCESRANPLPSDPCPPPMCHGGGTGPPPCQNLYG